MRYYLLGLLILSLFVALFFGPRGRHTTKSPIEVFSDMYRQPKLKYQAPSTFFADHQGARRPVEGTVPMGFKIPAHPGGPSAEEMVREIAMPGGDYSRGTDYLNTGRMGQVYGDGIPLPLTPEVLARGRERFEINCAVCHGATGAGNGQVSNFWSGAPVANLLEDRIRQMPDGQIFDTITHGKGVAPAWTMFPYGDKVPVKDRWAIISWLRTLQRAQRATLNDLTPAERDQLKNP